jgi:hypothetical protein
VLTYIICITYIAYYYYIFILHELFSLKTRRNETKWNGRKDTTNCYSLAFEFIYHVYCRSWNSPIRFGGNGRRRRVLIEIRWKFNNLCFLKHSHTHTVYTTSIHHFGPSHPRASSQGFSNSIFTQVLCPLFSRVLRRQGHSLFALVYDTVIVYERDP